MTSMFGMEKREVIRIKVKVSSSRRERSTTFSFGADPFGLKVTGLETRNGVYLSVVHRMH